MMFKNSVKLLVANFSTVWKLLLYYLIITLIGVGLVAPVFGSIGIVFRDFGFYEKFLDFITTFNLGSNVSSIFSAFGELLDIFIKSIVEYFHVYTGLAIYLTILLGFIMPILYGIASIPTGEILYGYMSSQARINFTGKVFTSLWKSIKYLLLKFVLATPINLLIFYTMYRSFEFMQLGGTLQLVAPLFIVMIFCVLMALRIILFSGWLPALIVNDCCAGNALKRGFIAVGRRFFTTLSTVVIIVIINVCLNVLFGSFCIAILLPVGVFFTTVFCFVMFYESQGMRYYVDSDTIITPKRLEEVDRFSRLKDLI